MAAQGGMVVGDAAPRSERRARAGSERRGGGGGVRNGCARTPRGCSEPSTRRAWRMRRLGPRTRHGPTVHARGTGVSKDNGARSGAQRGGADLMVIAVATRLS